MASSLLIHEELLMMSGDVSMERSHEDSHSLPSSSAVPPQGVTHKEAWAGGGYFLAHISWQVCVFFCFCCTFFPSSTLSLMKMEQSPSLAGTFSATHPTTPVTVTNDTGVPAQGSLLLMRKGRAEQAKPEHKWWCPDSVPPPVT